MRRFILFVLTLILISFVFTNCGGDDNPTTSTNKVPGELTLNSQAGTPINGATGVFLTPTLSWLCTDPDGDVLTFTVSFGTSTPPPVVSTDQSLSTYSPSSLANSTKYYWSITAKDPSGATSSSVVWNFTTLNSSVETINTPAVPSGPATGYENQDLSYSAHGSISSTGDGVEYRFDWGDSSFSDWSTTAIQKSWLVAGTYQVKTQARCVDHLTIVSEWSLATTVTITEFVLETVSTPDVPGGPISGEENQSLTFTSSGAVSSYGDDIQYRFDWGDGIISSWYNYGVSPSHSWSTTGTYIIKTQARCISHTTIESDWSADKTVTISVAGAETVSPPNAPTFPDSTEIGFATVFTVTGSISSDGHPVQYQMDFGDGTLTWFAYNTTIFHVYDSIGTYVVKAMARCNTHNDIISDWSEGVSVVIVNPPEALSYNTKLVYGDVVDGSIGELYEYSVAHSSATNLGDAMEGQYNWGDGTTSAWVQVADRIQSHAWTAEGTYGITYTGRCTVHNEFTFTTDTLWVTMVTQATETVAIPPYINWQDAQDHPMLDTETIYYAYGGLSSLGHDTEDRISWGDGDTTGWFAANAQILKTWTELGTFSMTRQSRCIAHPDITSEWSEISYIITGPETVSTPDAPPGPATATMGSAVYFLGTGAASSWHSNSWLSYRFAWGDGDTTVWRDRLDTLVGHNYSTVGEYEVTAQAKCVWPGHTNPISEWSLPSGISILESITMNSNVNGPVDGPINRSLTFELSSPATSSEGHGIEYRFAFGDSDTSLWAVELTASHTYTIAGTYSVKAQARCATHTDAMTEWPTTYFHWIDITDDPETVSIPQVTVGLQTTIGDSTYIELTKSSSNYGDSLEYQIDYGDGTFSEWFPTEYNSYYDRWEMVPEYVHHTYTAVGSYEVRGQARCVEHPTVISGWSAPTLWSTAEILEAVSMPATPTGPITGIIGENMTFTTTGATSSEGHQLEYQWSYRGPENQYTDYTTSLTDTKVFSLAGDYYVYILVRCVDHPDAQNGWSEKFYFTITQ